MMMKLRMVLMRSLPQRKHRRKVVSVGSKFLIAEPACSGTSVAMVFTGHPVYLLLRLKIDVCISCLL